MSGRFHPDKGETANSRTALLHDSYYFATELMQRLERLVDLEPDGHWQQSAILVRRVRAELRAQADMERKTAA